MTAAAIVAESASSITISVSVISAAVALAGMVLTLWKSRRDDTRAERKEGREEDTGERDAAKFWRDDSEAKERVVARLTEQLSALQATVEAQGVRIKEMEEAHDRELTGLETRHAQELAAKDAEIRRWTQKVDALEQRVAQLEGRVTP